MDKNFKRSAVDYFNKSDYVIYPSFENFQKRNKGKYVFLSRYGKKNYVDVKYPKNTNIYLIFGKETTGIDKEILARNINKTYRIPTLSEVRSLNLSNCVAIVAYDMVSKFNFLNFDLYEPDKYKGKNYLDMFL